MNKILSLLLLTLVTVTAKAEEIYLPNIQENVTGTLDGTKRLLDVNVALDGTTQNGGSTYTTGDKGGVSFAVRQDASGPLVGDGEYGPLQTDASGNLKVAATLSEEAVTAPGSSVPATVKVVGGTDGTTVRTLKTDASGELQVDVISSALPTGAATETTLGLMNAKIATVDTDDVSITSSVLPTGASTEATLSTLNGKVTAVDTGNVTIASSALPTGAATETTLSSLNTKVPANLTVTATRLLIDGSGVTQPVSLASAPLATGAATEAKQDSEISLLTTIDADTGSIAASATSIDGKLASDFGASTGAVRVAAIPGNATGIADFGAGAATIQTQRVVIANDQSAIAVTSSSVANTNSSFAEDATVGATAETFTKPANAVGFILQASSSNVGNIRWKAAGTATASSGHQLEPGRDTGFLPIATDVSYINESTTGDYIAITWVTP